MTLRSEIPNSASPVTLDKGIATRVWYQFFSGLADRFSTGVVAILDGGTGATTAAAARTNLGLAIGSDVQAWDAQLDDIAALGFTNGNFIVGDGTNWVAESGATVRASLGLTIGTDVQAWDAQLDDIAALAFTNGNFIVGDGTNWVAESGATVRASLGLVIGTDVQAWDAQLDDIAALAVTDSNFIVGDGTNWVVETGATARTSLGLTIGTNVQAWDAQLDDIAALALTDGNIIVGDGTNWVAESGATARTSLGVAIGSDVQAWDADLDTYAANPLTSDELGELQNIGSVTITNVQWAFVGGADQALKTTDDVTFDDLTITSFAANWTNAGRTVADGGIFTTLDLNGGTIDGTTIGASAVAAGSFAAIVGTTGTYSGVVSVDDTTASTGGTSGSVHTDGGLGVVLDAFIDGDVVIGSFLTLVTGGELTVASGVVTATASYHTIDTQDDDATDDLDTISGGRLNAILILSSASNGRDTTLKDGTGNLVLEGGADFVLSKLNDQIVLIERGGQWNELTRSTN